MEQIYMVEMLIDSLSIIVSDSDADPDTDKGFILKVFFGPKRELFFRETLLYDAKRGGDDQAYLDAEDGIRKWTRTLRVGRSFLYPSLPDTMLQSLVNFPLQIELWSDDLFEIGEMIGKGQMKWDSRFFFKLKDTISVLTLHEPLPLKQRATLKLECCCRDVAQVNFILRLSALGRSVTTEFQHLYEGFKDPELFVFRTNKSPTMIECRKFEGDDANFCMIGVLYDSITLDDPEHMGTKILEVCTNLRHCGTSTNEVDDTCHGRTDKKIPTEYPIAKIRMGDICGPCGNTNCDLAHKIKGYIRTLAAYKEQAKKNNVGQKPSQSKVSRVCGQCDCKDDRWHRGTCPTVEELPLCPGCGGLAHSGQTCEDRLKKFCSETNPKINYMTDIIYDNEQIQGMFGETNLKINYITDIIYNNEQIQGMFGKNFLIYPCDVNYNDVQKPKQQQQNLKKCICKTGQQQESLPDDSIKIERPVRTMASNFTPTVYNAEARADSSKKTNFCLDIPDEKDKDCKCNPPVPTPPCKSINCECLIRAEEEDSRKVHRPYCPCYKHRENCPVTKMNDDENLEGEPEKDVEEPEPLPYGLPPIQMGPCPVLGRPCTVPDGFSRMYKTAVMPTQPASWSEAGKVCCSKEFERIKKALKEYVTEHKKDDFRCLNKFYVDTERRCCDKEQRLLNLLGKSCCGSHKIAIQDHYKTKFEREASNKKNAETSNK